MNLAWEFAVWAVSRIGDIFRPPQRVTIELLDPMHVPPEPKLTRAEAVAVALKGWRADGNEGDLPKVFNLVVRGYRPKSMGPTPENDYGFWDDAHFLVTPTGFYPRTGNADPSRIGWNPGVDKPFGVLQPGVWYFYPGPHKGVRPAFRQADNAEVAKRYGIPHEGKFKVLRMWGRNDPRNAIEWGYQQVNIHPGSRNGTSSWLCLTLPPDTATNFLQRATDEIAKHGQRTLPVILVEGID